MDEELNNEPEYALTTIDNPYHPVDEYDDWLRYDEDHGYYTWNYLTRVAGTSPFLTEAENQRAINKAIDDILRLDILCMYRKVALTK